MATRLSDSEFEAIMSEPKHITENISWGRRGDNPSVSQFKVNIESDYPLFAHAHYNPDNPSLTYLIVHKMHGRIFGLDLGKDHHNPQCNQVGDRHLHVWSSRYRDKEAKTPDNITAPISDPVTVWHQFCEVANIEHRGQLAQPPQQQKELFQ